ncbi:DNA polymerase III subunit delta [Oryzibacter oryziterrae]|uniref:DNA polymerase III subunit delta n=1 Tax=Oryzibacter oryziterrae TaxID=2766474 RepID=UPI001F03199D|nr:DNA polymerase III subunit delta [Oryzibacter oryziterrae]
MVAAKASDADRIAEKPPREIAFYLVYGPDSGLVSERARKIAAAFSDPGDPFSLVKIDSSELGAGSTRLADEAYAVSMFASRKAILVRDSGRVDISGRLKPLFTERPQDTAVIVEAGDLKKTSPLRTLFEREKQAYAIACYVDDEAAIGRLIDDEAKTAGIAVSSEARAALIDLLGGDRLMTRGEIQKLCLYARGKPRIEIEDVETLIGDSSAIALDEIVDAAATGNATELCLLLAKARGEGIDAGQMIGTALRHFMMLDELRAEMDRGRPPGDAVESARPPIFFKRKAKVERALSLWPAQRLERAVTVLGEAARDTRLNAGLAADLAGETLLTLARVAAQGARKR